MTIIDQTIQNSFDHIRSARQELMKTRQFLSRNEHDIQDVRSMLQRMKFLGDNGLGVSFGSKLCDFFDSSKLLRDSQNALATHLSMAMSFVAEALVHTQTVDNSISDVSYYSYLQNIRMAISDIRLILSDYDTKQIPKDSIATSIARAETIARTMKGSRAVEISEMLRGLRQTIAYY